MADQRRKQNHSSGAGNVKKKPPVRKSKKRRRLRAGIFLTVLFAAGVCVLLSLTVLFRISTIEAAPSEHYSAEQIVEAAEIKTDTNLFMADRSAASERICSALPWIETAEVSIVLPDKVSVAVEEAQPALQLQQDGSYYLLSESLKILERSEKQALSDLPVITGIGMTATEPGQTAAFEREGMPELLLSLSQQLEESELSQVTGIDVTKIYSIELQYGENLTIKLGSSGNMEEKLHLAQYIIQNKLDLSQPGTLDLSQGNGQAIFRPDYGSAGIIIPPDDSVDFSQDTSSSESSASGE